MRKTLLFFTCLAVVSAFVWQSTRGQRPPKAHVPATETNSVALTSQNSNSSAEVRAARTNVTPAQISAERKRIQEELAKRGLYMDQADLIREQDNGEYVWKKIGDTKSVMFTVRGYLLEPFAPRTLDALDHVLANSTNADERLSAATLLYRYGRESGQSALLEVLKQGGTDARTVNAATTLALNRDESAKMEAVALLNRLNQTDRDFLNALGRWNDPSITEALVRRFKQMPNDDFIATALAYQENSMGLAVLRSDLARQGGDLNYISIRREAVVARLGGMEPSDFQSHFDGMLNKQPQVAAQMMGILEQAGPRVGGPELVKVLTDFIPQHQQWVKEAELQAAKVKASDPTAYHSYPKAIPLGALQGAAQLLSDWEMKSAVPLLEQVIVEMQQGTKQFNGLNQHLALALYRLDPVGWRDKLINAGLRLDHIDRIPEIAKLRPVAADQMPGQADLVWR